ncbi:MAG: PIN domain nuclease [Nitrospirae bacterium]|nr:PIN domain nuclease [Nitrospirota bacterium]
MKNFEKLAVDANPILSAIIGGKARAVFLKADNISFYTTSFNFREVEKYIPVLSAKKTIPPEDLYLALSTLPLCVCDEDFYKTEIQNAKSLIEQKDPKDIHLLALALKLKCSVWSNDKDFDDLGINIYSTLDFIKY